MKEKLAAIQLNLRLLLKRLEELEIPVPDYEVNAKLQKIMLKIDELSDLVTEMEADQEF
jgi:restriction endonuclease S subunit